MRWLVFASLAVVVAACGEPQLGLIATVRMQGLMRDEVRSVSVFACGPRRSDGIFLPCSSLLGQQISPTDKRVELLARADVSLVDEPGLSEIRLDEVSPGEGRVVYVEARGGGDVIVGSGCVEGVTVREGQATAVEVVVLRPR